MIICDNVQVLDVASERSIFMMIMMPHSIVDIDVDQFVSGRIPFNRAVKRLPGGFVCNDRLASVGVQFIWYPR